METSTAKLLRYIVVKPNGVNTLQCVTAASLSDRELKKYFSMIT